MKITIVTETYFPQVNGVSRTLSQLVRVLTESGDHVQLIHPDYGFPAVGIEHYRVPSVKIPFYQEIHVPLPPYRGVRRAIRRFAPDLVHIATEATLGLSVLRYADRLGVPIVSSFHTNFDQYSSHYRVGWSSGLIWRYLRWFHNRTRETYVPSKATMADLRRRGFQRLVHWPRGVDAKEFRPGRPGRATVRRALGVRPEEIVIAYVGRIAAEKNIDYLADVFERVRRARSHVRPMIVGDGPARQALRERLGDHATFVGFRTGEELADHYAAADLFAFASRTETFGNVVLEAMASGLPVVALAAGGPAEILKDGVTGAALAPDADPEAFTNALLELVDQPERRRQMAEQARAYALSQSWERVMGALRSRYLDVLGRTGEAPLPTAVLG